MCSAVVRQWTGHQAERDSDRKLFFVSIAPITGAGGAGHAVHKDGRFCCLCCISGRLVNVSIIIKRRKNKQIKIESMTAFEFISGIHRTNGSDNEQLFGKSHSLFAAPTATPPGKKGRHAVPPPGYGMLRFVRPVPGRPYTMRRSSSWTMTCRLINFYNCMHS